MYEDFGLKSCVRRQRQMQMEAAKRKHVERGRLLVDWVTWAHPMGICSDKKAWIAPPEMMAGLP